MELEFKNIKMDIYNQTCSKLEVIVSADDTLLARKLAFGELQNLAHQKELIQSLSLQPVFIKFLKFCFGAFFEFPEKLELCVDVLLLAGLSMTQLKKLSFDSILNRLQGIERYRELITNLKSCFGNFAVKRRGKKRVSFSESRNEVKYYVKEEENLVFKHGGYNEKDKSEALILKRGRHIEKTKEKNWYTPLKLDLTVSDEIYGTCKNREAERERNSFMITNTDPSTKFYPSKMLRDLEDNKGQWLPFTNYRIKNNLPSIELVEPKFEKCLEITVSDALNDPSCIQDVLDK